MATENDIVLIYFEDRPLSFARIESIRPDVKPNWYHVELLMLQMPLQVVSWILRDVYIDGEPFTMTGKKVRLELVEKPKPALVPEDSPKDEMVPKTTPEEETSDPSLAKVISLKDLKDQPG
jgi:hypothetical protein